MLDLLTLQSSTSLIYLTPTFTLYLFPQRISDDVRTIVEQIGLYRYTLFEDVTVFSIAPSWNQFATISRDQEQICGAIGREMLVHLGVSVSYTC